MLISSYGGDSESEDEENENLEKKVYDAIPKKPKHVRIVIFFHSLCHLKYEHSHNIQMFFSQVYFIETL